VLVRARVPNTASTLLPGMFVSVEVIVGDAAEKVTVPETAVSYNLYGDSVFVVAERAREDGGKELAVTRHYVQLGPRRNGRVAVTEGVAAGELVVTAGALKLDAGTVVTIDNSVKLSR